MHRREKSAIQRHRREIVDDLFLEEDLLAKMMREKLFTPGMIDDIKVLLFSNLFFVDDLFLEEDLLAKMMREKLFTPGMIDDIKSQRTMRDKTHRLLELLQKRGPEAFFKFADILREDYKWISDRLEETYKAKYETEDEAVDSARTPRQLQLSFPPTPRETHPKRLVSTSQSSRSIHNSFIRSSTVFFPETIEHISDETDGQEDDEERDIINGQTIDACVSPIQTLLPSRRYIHTASSPFPLSRSTSRNTYRVDEEAADHENDELLQLSDGRDEADARTDVTDETDTSDTDEDYNGTDEDKILEELFLKLYKINTENDTVADTEPDVEQVTLAMVHEEIDKLVQRVDNAEASLDQAYQAIGVQETKLPLDKHIQELQEKQDEITQELEKEKREKESMVNDMYYISQEMKRINNLKHRNEKIEAENKDLKEELEKTKQEMQLRTDQLQKQINEMERERTHTMLQHHQLPLQTQTQTTRKRTTTKSFLSPRRTQTMNLHQQSSFDLFSPKAKFGYKKK